MQSCTCRCFHNFLISIFLLRKADKITSVNVKNKTEKSFNPIRCVKDDINGISQNATLVKKPQILIWPSDTKFDFMLLMMIIDNTKMTGLSGYPQLRTA